jgi:2,5-diketo-D-gluconate reductase B
MGDIERHVVVRGVEVPRVGLGTWRLAGQVCYDMVRAALDVGYRHIDTAHLYLNEEEVGRALRDSNFPREMIFLTTKLSFDRMHHDEVIQTSEQSLLRLKTDYVDLLLIHWPSADVPLKETLDAMAELHARGRVRHVGVSNFPSALLREACRLSPLPILANQVEYHPYLSQQKVLEVCRQEQVMLTAYAPTGRAKVLQDDVIKGIAARCGKTPVQVALRWLIQQPLVSAIPKSAHLDRVKENFNVFDFQLTPDEMEAIFALARGERMLNPASAPKWDD